MSKQAVVVDTNIVFSALRLQYSALRDILADQQYQFFAPKFLIVEIFKHKEKILKDNSQQEDDFYEYLNAVLHQIQFVNEAVVSIGNYMEAHRLCKDIDPKDTPFVALAIELNCPLWTRDQPIRQGLAHKGFTAFIDL
jgi:predicted nucleic acid-binding protein